MKLIRIILIAATIAICGCDRIEEPTPNPDKTEQEGNSGNKDDGNGQDKPGIDNPGTDNPGTDNPGTDNPGDDKPGTDNPSEDDEPVEVTVVDPGEKYTSSRPTPQHPELEHSVSYTDFYNCVQDELDEYGNIDYVCAQGDGAAWPYITREGFIRFYQGTSSSKGGGYIRVRSHNGAIIQEVTVGSATKTRLAYSLDGKAKKSETTEVAAGGKYKVTPSEKCSQVCLWCMATDNSERWEMNYIEIKYKGGFCELDSDAPTKEYGPLVRVKLPFKEGFENGFNSTDTPTYNKYGLQSGRENLEWSTWFGSFSWQAAITGDQSAQLRVYQEDEDYDKEQFGYLKTEFFIEGLSKLSFDYNFSEFWNCAIISYCEFGSNEWKNPQLIALNKYDDRGKTQKFSYSLGKTANAKIRIMISPDTGFPTKGHYDFIFDNFVFE